MPILKEKTAFLLICLFSITISFLGCATGYIKVSELNNPPPKKVFSDFDNFEMKDIVLSPEYESQPANVKAKDKIQAVLNARLSNVLESWGQKEIRGSGATLIIEPKITHVKFIGGNARFWVGPFAGSSAVIMEVILKNMETGEIIAQPEFYQQSNAWSGSFTLGATDNDMLTRIADLLIDYMIANYSEAVGGPTGKPKE